MEQVHKDALRRCRPRLVKDLSIVDMFDSMDACALFTTTTLECIKAKESRPEKVRLFLDYLQRRGPDAFDKFLHCLRESGHDFVVSYVLQECEQISQGQSPSTIPSNVYVAQETQSPGDVEMGENSQGDINLGDNTMEVCPSVQTGVQESATSGPSSQGASLSNIPVLSTHGTSLSNIPGLSSQGTHSQSNIPDARTQGTRNYSGSASMGAFNSPINPAASTFHHSGYSGNYAEEYKMESNPRGFLLIINNKEFSADFGVRTGTDVDCNRLETLFSSLGFSVEARHNLTALEIKANLQLLSQYEKLHNVDCLAVAILTHGNEDYLYGVDGIFINVREAFKSFTAENCPALHHKPKLFIVNACRGDEEDKGSLTSGVYETNGPVSTDTNHVRPESGECCRIPNMKDFLVAYSTIPGHVSWRHQNDGSFFIQGFVDVFEKNAQAMDVMKMLVKVNAEVSKKVNHQGVQIPAPQVMLTKTWYLNPIVRC